MKQHKRIKLFDERELLIRNRVYKHGFIFLLLLLLVDILIRDYGHVDLQVAEAIETLREVGLYSPGLWELIGWDHYIFGYAVPFVQGQWNLLLYITLAIAFVFIEFAIRGVYLHRFDTPAARLTLTLLMMSGWAIRLHTDLNTMRFFEETIMEQGQISRRGIFVVVTFVLIFTGLCVSVRAIVDIIRNQINKKE